MSVQTQFDTLENELQGKIIAPQDSEYDTRRSIWNARIDKKPAAIALCRNSDDVVACINYARQNDIIISVRGGGHDYAGNSVCDDGLMIDLSEMKGIDINPDKKTARVGPGVKWGEFDEKAQKHGLATPGGTCSQAGVAGVTLGGGSGFLTRKYGLSIDNLLGAEIVLAGGEITHAGPDENEDLFWAIRGGSGNFGIVTSFEFKMHKVGPEIMAGQIIYPFDSSRDVLKHFCEFMPQAPDEIQCYPFIFRIPPIPAFPENLHSKMAIGMAVSHCGEISDGEKALQPLRDFGDPIADTVQPMKFIDLQQSFDPGLPAGQRYYSKALYLDNITDDAIDIVLKYTENIPGIFTIAYFEPMGGAAVRVDPQATAFPHRNAAYGLNILAGWSDAGEDEKLMKWAADFHKEISAHANGGVYVNMLGEKNSDLIHSAYGANYDRLAKLKSKFDPGNLFRMNQNIKPE